MRFVDSMGVKATTIIFHHKAHVVRLPDDRNHDLGRMRVR